MPACKPPYSLLRYRKHAPTCMHSRAGGPNPILSLLWERFKRKQLPKCLYGKEVTSVLVDGSCGYTHALLYAFSFSRAAYIESISVHYLRSIFCGYASHPVTDVRTCQTRHGSVSSKQTRPATEFIAPMHTSHGYTPAFFCRMVVRGHSQKSSRIIKQEPGPTDIIVSPLSSLCTLNQNEQQPLIHETAQVQCSLALTQR